MKKNIVIIILTLLLVCALTAIVLMIVYINDIKKDNRIEESLRMDEETVLCLGLKE